MFWLGVPEYMINRCMFGLQSHLNVATLRHSSIVVGSNGGVHNLDLNISSFDDIFITLLLRRHSWLSESLELEQEIHLVSILKLDCVNVSEAVL